MSHPGQRAHPATRKAGTVAGLAAAAVGCAQLLPPAAQTGAQTGAQTTTQTATPAPASVAAPADLSALRDWARESAKVHCGTCHIASLPSAKPAALAIFNLDAADWSSTLSPERLRAGFTRRLNGRLDEPGQQRLRAFVESEISMRGK